MDTLKLKCPKCGGPMIADYFEGGEISPTLDSGSLAQITCIKCRYKKEKYTP